MNFMSHQKWDYTFKNQFIYRLSVFIYSVLVIKVSELPGNAWNQLVYQYELHPRVGIFPQKTLNTKNMIMSQMKNKIRFPLLWWYKVFTCVCCQSKLKFQECNSVRFPEELTGASSYTHSPLNIHPVHHIHTFNQKSLVFPHCYSQ